MKRFLFLLTGILVLTFSVSAQIENPVSWIYTSKQIAPQEYELILTAYIESPWHLYSQDIPQAPPATTFKFDKDSAFTLLGKVVEKGKRLSGRYIFSLGCQFPPRSSLDNARAMNQAIEDYGRYESE